LNNFQTQTPQLVLTASTDKLNNHHRKIMKRLILPICLAGLCRIVAAQNAPATGDENGFTGKVLETTNTAGYTYVCVDTGTRTNWAAATELAVKVGDTVTVGAGVPMTQYHSRTLNRDFGVVYFTGSITIGGKDSTTAAAALPPGHPPLTGAQNPAFPPGHPPITASAAAPNLDLTGIKRAAGGKTVQEIIDAAKKLSGKPVAVRGRVVKYNSAIMGKNWLHIRDGSGSDDKADNDIAVTTTNAVKLGDIVLVKGNVSTDRDFGAGYRYSVMIEDAAVTTE
jgi:hypothetical protein